VFLCKNPVALIELKRVLSRLICNPDRRMSVEPIKKHPFFYGVEWDMIREIDAPFVPRLRSMTDTSYFPTDELQDVSDEPAGADTSGAGKDLAFLGYTFKRFVSNDRAL
jgi:protein-serine/threonine kinase